MRLAVAALTLAACVSSPRGYTQRTVPDITIITADEAARYGLTSQPIELAFGAGRNGSDVVIELLRAAHAQGARYVGGIEMHVATTIEGQNADCTTAIGPKEEIQVRNELAMKPGQMKSEMVMKPVSRMETHYEYRCHSEMRPRTRSETTYEYQYDYMTHSSHSVPRTRTVTEYVSEQECRNEPVTRYETRYEWQWESHYVPGTWEMVSKTYSHWELVESKPVCTPDPDAVNHVSASVFVKPAPPPSASGTASCPSSPAPSSRPGCPSGS